jgi:hypothetical protein
MSNSNLIALILMPFVIQPVLLGIYVRKHPCRSGILWGLLAFAINIGIITFFEMHKSGQLFGDAVAEVGTTIFISTMFILALLEVLRKGPHAPTAGSFPIHLWRGLSRIWITIFTGWTVFCAIAFHEYSKYSCEYLHYLLSDQGICFRGYWDVAKWFIPIPALVFMIVLASCWVVEGFRRQKAFDRAGG